MERIYSQTIVYVIVQGLGLIVPRIVISLTLFKKFSLWTLKAGQIKKKTV